MNQVREHWVTLRFLVKYINTQLEERAVFETSPHDVLPHTRGPALFI